jgi:hypothetical protein
VRGLRQELARVGIRGTLADRIVAELDDHLACDPGAELGEPRVIAERFADELRLPRTRRAAYIAFAGLAFAAALLGALLGHAPNRHGSAGTVVALAGLLLVLAAQVAFVGGTLALWGARFGTAAAIVQRRVLVALGAGAMVLAAEAVDAVALRQWLVLLALAPAPVLAWSGRELWAARALTPAGEVSSRGFGGAGAAAVGLLAVGFVAVGSAFAEDSWAEGLTRGGVELAAFLVGLFALGRYLGIIRE